MRNNILAHDSSGQIFVVQTRKRNLTTPDKHWVDGCPPNFNSRPGDNKAHPLAGRGSFTRLTLLQLKEGRHVYNDRGGVKFMTEPISGEARRVLKRIREVIIVQRQLLEAWWRHGFGVASPDF